MCIKSDAKNGQQCQKWLSVVSEILSKIGIDFILNFLLKARVWYLTILKRKVKQTCMSFVWFYQSVFLSKSVAFHPRTVKQIVTAPMPSLLFRCFSLFLPHLRTLAQEKRSESSFWDWWAESLFLSIIVAKYKIFLHANNGHSREKKFWRSDLLAKSACNIETLSTLSYTEFDCAALLAI